VRAYVRKYLRRKLLYITKVTLCLLLSAHVFFDDAMELDDDEERVVNNFVKLLVKCMDEAARCGLLSAR